MNCQICHEPIENLALHIHFNPGCRVQYVNLHAIGDSQRSNPSNYTVLRLFYESLVAFPTTTR